MKRILKVMMSMLLMMALCASPAMAAKKSTVVPIMKVTVDGGRLREGPSSEYEVVTSLKKGEKVFYFKKEGSFCLVRSETGKMGYIYKGFLANYGAARLDQVYQVGESGAKMYKKASTSSKKKLTLKSDQYILVYKTHRDWAYARTLSGTAGFVKLDDISSITD